MDEILKAKLLKAKDEALESGWTLNKFNASESSLIPPPDSKYRMWASRIHKVDNLYIPEYVLKAFPQEK